MKRFAIAALLGLTSFGALPLTALADTLPAYALNDASTLVPDVNFSNLTSGQVQEIMSVLYSKAKDRGGMIRAIVEGSSDLDQG